ncbi:MAG: toxin glutamine deamidase domain-containing protein [Methylococcaceae bacterium]
MLSPEPWPKEKTQEDAPAEKTTQEHEETLLEAIKEYLGWVARGEILKENLARYEDLLERSRAGDIQANRDMINEFAGFGGIAKVGKLAKGTKSVDAVKNADDIAEAGVKNVGSEEMAGSIRNVNPTKGKQNCVNCSIATDSTLAGRPASALPGQPASVRTLEKNFGGKFGAATSKSGIEGALLKSGDGARGIVFGSRGSQTGHVFNVVNQKGTIRFLVGQTGKVANLDGFNSLHLLKTTK